MTIALSLKKLTAAAVVAAPLTLVVACGSNGEEADQEAAGASTVTSEATASTEEEAPDGEGDAAEGGDTDAEGDGAADGDPDAEDPAGAGAGGARGAGGGSSDREPDSAMPAAGSSTGGGAAAGGAAAGGAAAAAGVHNPLGTGDIQVVEQEPVEDGQVADDQSAQEIRGLVENSYSQQSLHDFISYVPDNTCQRVIDANGGEQAFNLDGVPNMQMSDMPGWNDMHVSDVSNIAVAGDEASASVTVQTAQGPDTQTQRFLHEGGQWKFCDGQ